MNEKASLILLFVITIIFLETLRETDRVGNDKKYALFAPEKLFDHHSSQQYELKPKNTTGVNNFFTDMNRNFYVLIGGDVILQKQIIDIAEKHSGSSKSSALGWKWFFNALEPILRKYDEMGGKFFIVNLESPVARQRIETKSYPPVFNGPKQALSGMKSAGVDAVTLSNNHALDQGREGLLETLASAFESGLKTIGAGKNLKEAKDPVIIVSENANFKIAVFSFLVRKGGKSEPENRPSISVYQEGDEVLVRKILDGGEVNSAIVILHWIGEFLENPPSFLRRVVENFVSAGAVAVICHGPHVVGKVEWIEQNGNRGFVAYSVGNLLANFGWEVYPSNFKNLVKDKTSSRRIEARTEALIVLEFGRKGVSNAIQLGSVTAYPLWLEDNRYASLRKSGGIREIYPMPVPACIPQPEFGCSKGSTLKECELRWEMIFYSVRGMIEKLWNIKFPDIVGCSRHKGYENEEVFPLLTFEL